MAINYATSINSGLYASAVVTDAAYQVGGTYIPLTSTHLGGNALSAVVGAPGTGYAPADTITVAGGTFSAAAVATVTNTRLVSGAANAAGTGYVNGEVVTVTAVGGTMTTAATFKVTHTKVVSATIAAGGTGYGNVATFDATVAIGTGTAVTNATVNVTTNSSGVVTTVNSVSNAGDYTTNPSNIATNPVTGGAGTGLTLVLVFGVKNVALVTGGVFTTNSTSFTQASTTGAGTGLTINTPAYGVNVVSISTVGSYTILPAQPMAQASTSGTGTGATLSATWGTTSTHEQNILCLIELLRSYTATIGTVAEAKLASEALRHAAAELASGSGLSTIPARVQASTMKIYADPRRASF